MRALVLMRGAPGCGKSTWVKANGFDKYALSADTIREMCSTLPTGKSGKREINQKNDMVVWKILFEILETRMKNGEFTVIDATNSKASEMNKYKELCQKYRYRIFCVDMTDVPIDVCKAQNKMRPEYKWVPESVLDNMYARFESQKIPSGIKVIKPSEVNEIFFKKIDLSAYRKIHIIGDVHGCYTALMQYIGEINSDDFYIFCGDYVDRGLENAEVVKFMLNVYKLNNVLFLEGNHETRLWSWANNEPTSNKEFEVGTVAQLETARIDKKEVRKLYRTFGQCAYFEYHGEDFVVTHGGISRMPDIFMAASQMIKGVGSYPDIVGCYESFEKNTPDNVFQINGHRNIQRMPVQNGRCFNLEGKVEFGGCLRCLELTPVSKKCIEVKNEVYKDKELLIPDKERTVAGLVVDFRNKPNMINEKKFGNISSFNFTKTAFFDKQWNNLSVKARGLYINVPKEKIVARSYDKFFNLNERPETEEENLPDILKFPVTAYVKENGFLGILSYSEETDDFFITSKSRPDGEYAEYFKDILYKTVLNNPSRTAAIKGYLKKNNVSFVFECIDIVNDPHIIEYEESKVVLLDVIENELILKKLDYESLLKLAEYFDIPVKEKAYVIESWGDFLKWKDMVQAEDYLYNDRNIEGFVIEDSDGFMFKMKLYYYNFWKFMRSFSVRYIKSGSLSPREASSLTTPTANSFYGFLKERRNEYLEKGVPDIISMRKDFLRKVNRRKRQ